MLPEKQGFAERVYYFAVVKPATYRSKGAYLLVTLVVTPAVAGRRWPFLDRRLAGCGDRPAIRPRILQILEIFLLHSASPLVKLTPV
jgi:hypothetical protein